MMWMDGLIACIGGTILGAQILLRGYRLTGTELFFWWLFTAGCGIATLTVWNSR